MNKKALRADLLLLLTAAIWGFGFVAQRSGMEYIGPFAFNGIRFILGSLSLLPLIFFRRKKLKLSVSLSSPPFPFKHVVLSSFIAGCLLFVAVILQQIGIIFTTAGNAGFITGLYVVFTPVFGIFLKRKTGLPTWIGSALTLAGLYFISVAGNPGSINPGDIIIFVSAFFWTAHVLLIDRLMNAANHSKNDKQLILESAVVSAESQSKLDPVELSCGQFAFCGFFSLIGAFTAEPYVVRIVESIDSSLLSIGLFSWLPFLELIKAVSSGAVMITAEAIIPILYGGLCSVGIAYTLQVAAQRDAPPAHATIILCFEGCFAALGGALLLSEKFGTWTLFGFAFMLAGMMFTQIDIQKRKK